MRIGLSLSRCMLDIIEKRIDYDDVLVIITRTDFDPKNDDHWAAIWKGYAGTYFGSVTHWSNHQDDEAEFRELAIRLHNDGKLHQPRQFGAHPPRVRYHWLETLAPDEDVERNPSVKKAWDNYKIIAGLS